MLFQVTFCTSRAPMKQSNNSAGYLPHALVTVPHDNSINHDIPWFSFVSVTFPDAAPKVDIRRCQQIIGHEQQPFQMTHESLCRWISKYFLLQNIVVGHTSLPSLTDFSFSSSSNSWVIRKECTVYLTYVKYADVQAVTVHQSSWWLNRASCSTWCVAIWDRHTLRH
jgi:hypothetical protein